MTQEFGVFTAQSSTAQSSDKAVVASAVAWQLTAVESMSTALPRNKNDKGTIWQQQFVQHVRMPSLLPAR